MVSERFVRSTSLSRVTAGTGRWKCCQCGNVASSNVANGQWGGLAGAEARWDLRAWKPATPMKPALPPCGRAVDEAVVTFPVRDGVRELALRRKIAGDVLIVRGRHLQVDTETFMRVKNTNSFP